MRRRHGIPARGVRRRLVRPDDRREADGRPAHDARSLREQGVDALLLLVGDGDDRERLEQLAHELGVARSCLFLGYQEDVAPWYAISDAVVLTSASEGTPVTIIEALAAGRPVVATDVGGVSDVVDEGETGFLVPPGDTEALAASSRSSRRPGAPRDDGERGARAGAPALRRRRLVDDVDALYRELLATTSATTRR